MRIVFNLLLVLLIGFLTWMIYNSIREPIAFQAEKTKRKDRVVERLEDLRTAQEIYRVITGEFTDDFDSLNYVLRNDSIPFVKIIGDPDDPENADLFEKIVTYSMAIDTVNALGLNLDSLRYVPYTGGKVFEMEADTTTYQSTLVQVVEAGTRWKDFMGPFADTRFKKYDDSYEPDRMIKFGDMTKPSLSGNWR